MKRNLWTAVTGAACLVATALLSSCENEEQARRLRELEQEVDDRASDIEAMRVRLEESSNEVAKLQEAVAKAESDKRTAESKLSQAETQIEALRKIQEAAKASIENKTPHQKLQDARQAAQEKVAAVWTIEGDQGPGRGFVAETDGKTWLYLPASLLGGSLKLEVGLLLSLVAIHLSKDNGIEQPVCPQLVGQSTLLAEPVLLVADSHHHHFGMSLEASEILLRRSAKL